MLLRLDFRSGAPSPAQDSPQRHLTSAGTRGSLPAADRHTRASEAAWPGKCVTAWADSGLVRQSPSLLGPVSIMDHVANCLELGVDLKQEPRDRAEGNNRQEK